MSSLFDLFISINIVVVMRASRASGGRTDETSTSWRDAFNVQTARVPIVRDELHELRQLVLLVMPYHRRREGGDGGVDDNSAIGVHHYTY